MAARVRPFRDFVATEAGSSLLLLAATLAALAWANSPLAPSYFELLATPLAIPLGLHTLSLSLAHWVNDALMALFFFVVGLEIKRELSVGELSTRAKALLPAIAALGGMLVPASIYAGFHAGGPAAAGWGVPMATDIAFAVAVLGAFGARVPLGLRIFLLAIAIADDLGAVVVIALYYARELTPVWLGAALVGLALLVALERVGVRALAPYWVVGAAVWLATHESGVHATVAGVAMGLLTPLRYRGRVAEGGPLARLEHALHPWVAYAIMPIFALANAGVALEAPPPDASAAPRVILAVVLGLVVGKPVGITLFAWLAVKSGFAELPRGVTWTSVLAAGMLGGVGFTMSLFITALAFDDAGLAAASKIGVLAASALAALAGTACLARVLPRAPR